MNTIEKLFEEKLKPAVAEELKNRDSIVDQRRKIETDRLSFLKKVEAVNETITTLEKSLDELVIAGKKVDDVSGKIAIKQSEKAALDRQIRLLVDQDMDLADALGKANVGLSAALGAAIDSLRPDVQALVENHLEAALAVLVSFENSGHDAEAACGVELPKEKDLAVYRFLNLGDHFKRLGAWLDGCGEDMSAIRRREVRQQWAGKNKIAA